jgi:propionyl-CoA synthetase
VCGGRRADALKGFVPAAFVTLVAGADAAPEAIAGEVNVRVRAAIGPVTALKTVVVVPLPKTRSGKVLRSTMRDLASGGHARVPATIGRLRRVGEIADALAALQSPAAGR